MEVGGGPEVYLMYACVHVRACVRARVTGRFSLLMPLASEFVIDSHKNAGKEGFNTI